MSARQDARGVTAVARFLNPRSIAIVGMSTRAGSAGQVILQCLKVNEFAGDVHLVGRSDAPIDGRPVLKSADELPEGVVDLAVFTLPAASVRDAMEACARRKVGTAMVFAAGFAETGDYATQDAVATTARAAGLAIVGPNCLGVTNNVGGLWLHMLYARKALRGVENGVAFVGQSGGLLGHFQRATDGRGIPLSYVISTGNEAGLETTDFIEFLVDDAATRVIVAYCEEIRRPQAFLAAIRRSRAAGKPVVLILAGRSAKARKAAQSHTGALMGDYGMIRTQVEDAGAVVVSAMDETMDLVEILQRFPDPPAKGPGIITASGAYVGLTNDFAEGVGLELPELEPATLNKIRETLPSYGNYGNPLDTTAGFAPAMLPVVTKAVIDDPNVGMLFISFPINTPIPVKGFNEGMRHSDKPKVMCALGDTWPLGPEVAEAAKESPAVYSRSSDRMLRAVAHYTRYGRQLARKPGVGTAAPVAGLPALAKGAQPEWLGKRVLAAVGISVPPGVLARTPNEAVAIARDIGYPVVLKAQAAALSHKTEAGGVALNLADEGALRAAWDHMIGNVRRTAPDVVLDGVLVEQMSPRGIELMVGAKRDPGWGTVLLLGLGGIWVEALGDVQLLPSKADATQIRAALGKLHAAKLLAGVRGAPPADVDAVVRVVLAIDRLMQNLPGITEIDVNPLMVHAEGEGATALDALIVAGS
ncbi:MAG TPA: acetate--CoA ligase family protein [Xanthobacteraceae bacterium]|nr:acetate--CoA ligase family protein [Xanthobacteraceae bacterium]